MLLQRHHPCSATHHAASRKTNAAVIKQARKPRCPTSSSCSTSSSAAVAATAAVPSSSPTSKQSAPQPQPQQQPTPASHAYTPSGSPAPSFAEWQRLWQLWDTVTLDMIPAGCHTAQPLALRHPFIFYLGHLPAFSDARLARVLGQELTEPRGFAVTFARGIDPDLQDPTKCKLSGRSLVSCR
jgi:hypothetical protein